ncbi:L,D-transpeptidase [Thalassobacillus hwangdonensis]|uniref:L,D-transpeptidase n=1 Tax=Thalassobacillus hwangdonensis TaxID=546108 RepID=A0ABW3KZV9_9BACI
MKSLLLFMFLSLTVPGVHTGMTDPVIIVNKASNELAFFDKGKLQNVYPVATGKTEALTPTGTFTIKVKAKDPYYRKKNIPGGDPRNPLGSRWIGFDAKGTDGRIYGVHGTNQPSSIGRNVSQGCIRMHNKNVEALYDKVPNGAKIVIVNEDRKFEAIYDEYLKNRLSQQFQ